MELRIVKTALELCELESYLKDKDFVAYDTETTGVDKDAKVIGLSVSAEVDLGWYVVLAYWDPSTSQLKYLESAEYIEPLLAKLQSKKLIMHNAVFDCIKTADNFGIELHESVHTDTMLLAHLLDENRPCGLKELAVELYGEDVRKEQTEMKESVTKNGGVLTKAKYELYKADADLIAKYGAMDAILTLKLFYEFIPELYNQQLDEFFYEETMPLLRTASYQLNSTGLRIDTEKLKTLKQELETECLQLKAYIYNEIDKHIKDLYPGTNKKNTFNIGAPRQLSWLLFEKLGNSFNLLTDSGRDLCKALGLKLPYALKDKRKFIESVKSHKDQIIADKKVSNYWNYLKCDEAALQLLAHKYKWVEKLLKYKKSLKLLNTYVEGIQERLRYGVIHPSFLQHGTTSGRFSSREPNFQNLPRDDKRIKSCVVARPGKVFVGSDQSQLEPRVFASLSQDTRLVTCFDVGDDFYSVIGSEVFDKPECSLKKDDNNSFAHEYPDLRQISKVVALSATYGTTAPKMSPLIKRPLEETQLVIDSYFEKFPDVHNFMLESHDMAKRDGVVYTMFGRPRRIPEAKNIERLYGKTEHARLPANQRTYLNLAVNHRVQGAAASIMNRVSIRFCKLVKDHNIQDCKLVLQVHDELNAECKQEDAQLVAKLIKEAMENTVQLPGVKLKAEPKIAYNLADLK